MVMEKEGKVILIGGGSGRSTAMLFDELRERASNMKVPFDVVTVESDVIDNIRKRIPLKHGEYIEHPFTGLGDERIKHK